MLYIFFHHGAELAVDAINRLITLFAIHNSILSAAARSPETAAGKKEATL